MLHDSPRLACHLARLESRRSFDFLCVLCELLLESFSLHSEAKNLTGVHRGRRESQKTLLPEVANRGGALGDHVVNHAAMDVGQAEIATAVMIRQPRVIDAQQVEDRGMQIVNVHAIFDGVHS